MKKLLVILIYFFLAASAFSQVLAIDNTRSFNQIFPGIGREVRDAAFSETGYVRSGKRSDGFVIIGSRANTSLNPQIINNVLSKNPGYVVESILILQTDPNSVNLLDIYNALGNIRGLRGRLYDSATRGQMSPLFEDATRIVSGRQTAAIPDPAPARNLPLTETIYIKLKDANFGNTFYRGDIAVIQNGLCYTLTNIRNMSYLFVTVIREEKFTAQLYIEPIAEGVLIYSIAGTDISDFIASRIHIESAISKRLAVITAWAADEIINKGKR